MNKGRFQITHDLICRSLQFPDDWKIEKITPSVNEKGVLIEGQSEMIVSGSAFPEVKEGGRIQEVDIVVHKHMIHFDVKPRKRE